MLLYVQNFALGHPNVQALLADDTEEFDLILFDVHGGDPLLGLAAFYGAPAVGLSTMSINKWATDLVGSPTTSSIIPHMYTDYTEEMSFNERYINLVTGICDYYLKRYSFVYNADIIQKRWLPYNPNLLDIQQPRVSMVLANSHHTIAGLRPLQPNLIEVGGLHIDFNENVTIKYPTILNDYLKNSKNGLIYFSLGSNIQTNGLELNMLRAILKAFTPIKQRILFKWEGGSLPGPPRNMILSHWFPQRDLFAQADIRVFITHGGTHSALEAIYYGIPIIGIPFVGEQYIHVNNAVKHGYGILLEYNNVTATSLTWAIEEILNNNK